MDRRRAPSHPERLFERAQLRDDLRDVERLLEEREEPECARASDERGRGAAGPDDERQIGLSGAKRLRGLYAVPPRHPKVEDGAGEGARPDSLGREPSLGELLDLDAVSLERPTERAPQRPVVVDDHHA